MDDAARHPDDELSPLTHCDEPEPRGPIKRGFKNGLIIGTCVAIAASVPIASRLYNDVSGAAAGGQSGFAYSLTFILIFAVIVIVGGCAGAVAVAMARARSDPRPWWRRWLPRFSLRTMLAFQAVIAALLAVPYVWPKSEQLTVFVPQSDDNIGYYHGLGWHDGRGYFGKNFYRFRISMGGGDPIEYVDVDVFFSKEESSPFRAYYPDGTLRFEGVGSVEFSGPDSNDPMPNTDYPKTGKYYKPDGTLGSEIVDGTGVATIWRSDGTKASEWRIENYEFVSWIHYDLAGNVTNRITP